MKTVSQVDSLLSKPCQRVERTKASFNLDKKLADGFRALCEERDVTQSELLDALLADLLARHTPAGVRAPPARSNFSQ